MLTKWRNSVQMIQLFSSSFPVFQSIKLHNNAPFQHFVLHSYEKEEITQHGSASVTSVCWKLKYFPRIATKSSSGGCDAPLNVIHTFHFLPIELQQRTKIG